MAEHRLLTRRGFAVLAASVLCFIAANVLGTWLLAYLSMLFGLLLILGALAIFLPGARGGVTRTISTDLISVGGRSRVTIRLRLRGRLIRRARWQDTLPEALEARAEGFVAEVGENGDTREPLVVDYPVTGARRGVWPLGPLFVRTSDPFGLIQRQQRIGTSRMITVVPRLVDIPVLATAPGASEGTVQTLAHRIGPGVDNLAPRRYFSGDSRRRIHWRATAHRGELMVRQEDEETSPDALVVLDLSPSRWAPARGEADPHFERAVSAAASAAVLLSERGYLVDLISAEGRVLGALRGQEGDRTALLVNLSEVAPGGRDVVPRIEETLRGPLVVISGRLPADQLPVHPGGTSLALIAEPDPGVLALLSARGWQAQLLEEAVPDA